MKKRLFCIECSIKFGNNLAKVSTAVAFNLHNSILHSQKIDKMAPRNEANPHDVIQDGLIYDPSKTFSLSLYNSQSFRILSDICGCKCE